MSMFGVPAKRKATRNSLAVANMEKNEGWDLTRQHVARCTVYSWGREFGCAKTDSMAKEEAKPSRNRIQVAKRGVVQGG